MLGYMAAGFAVIGFLSFAANKGSLTGWGASCFAAALICTVILFVA